MKAIVHTPESLVISDVPTPEISGRKVLIKAKATAVNRADILQKKGKYPPPKGESEILGLEVAGIVETIGEDCQILKKGDEVCALLAGGGYAEYVAVDERLCFPIPDGLSFQQAVAIPEVFLTAFQALCWLGKVQAKDFVLIHAGASGVGSAAIQLVKSIGAKPIITAGSEEKLAFCSELGAVHTINYKNSDFAEEIKDFTKGKGADVLLDFIGASYFEQNLASIEQDGRWILLGMLGGHKAKDFNLAKLLMKRVHLIGSTLRARNIDYKSALIQDFGKQFLPAFSNGELKPVVDSIFPWQEADKAHERMEQNLNMGKIVLEIA